MAIGTYSFTSGHAVNNADLITATTVSQQVSFDVAVNLRSVYITPFTGYGGSVTAKAVIWRVSDSTKIGEGTLASITQVSGSYTEWAFNTPVPIVAGVSYRIGVYISSSSVSYPAAIATNFGTHSHTSSSSYFTVTTNSNNYYTGSGDVYPTSSGTTGELLFGLSADVPSAMPTTLVPANNATVSNFSTLTFSWTVTGAAQTGYEFGYRKRASRDPNWTLITNLSTSTPSIAFSAETFEDGDYEWYVKLYSSGGTGLSSLQRFTVDSGWTTQTEVSSSTASGVINATGFAVGTYDVEVRVADASGRYGNWSTLQTFTLGPPSNTKTRVGGTFVQTTKKVKQGGVWVDVPPTKTRIGGTFV